MDNHKPLISVIVPIYNTDKYLQKCINSVLEQDYRNIELILINDGSTDKSGDICDNFRKKDNRVIVFHESNKGAASARNKGLDNASGDFIMFLDSDDYWVENCLGEIVDKLAEYDYDVDVTFLKTAVVKNNGTLTEFKGYEFEYLNRNEVLEYISKQKKVAVSACLKVLHKRLFENKEMYFQDSLLAEDIDWFFSLLTVAESYTTYDGEFYCYRILENSATRSTSEKRIHDYFYILNKWIENAENIDNVRYYKKYFYFMIGYEYEILISTLYDYHEDIRNRYIKKLKEIFWLLKYRTGIRSRLIKFLKLLVGFNNTCRILNFYLHNRNIK